MGERMMQILGGLILVVSRAMCIVLLLQENRSRHSAIRGLGARRKVPCSRNPADKLRGHVPPATSICGAGVSP